MADAHARNPELLALRRVMDKLRKRMNMVKSKRGKPKEDLDQASLECMAEAPRVAGTSPLDISQADTGSLGAAAPAEPRGYSSSTADKDTLAIRGQRRLPQVIIHRSRSVVDRLLRHC